MIIKNTKTFRQESRAQHMFHQNKKFAMDDKGLGEESAW